MNCGWLTTIKVYSGHCFISHKSAVFQASLMTIRYWWMHHFVLNERNIAFSNQTNCVYLYWFWWQIYRISGQKLFQLQIHFVKKLFVLEDFTQSLFFCLFVRTTAVQICNSMANYVLLVTYDIPIFNCVQCHNANDVLSNNLYRSQQTHLIRLQSSYFSHTQSLLNPRKKTKPLIFPLVSHFLLFPHIFYYF